MDHLTSSLHKNHIIVFFIPSEIKCIFFIFSEMNLLMYHTFRDEISYLLLKKRRNFWEKNNDENGGKGTNWVEGRVPNPNWKHGWQKRHVGWLGTIHDVVQNEQ